MQRNYTVVLAVACVVIYSWLCTWMIPLLALRTKPVLVVLYGGSWSLDEGR
jgi:hypothetical protein